MLCFRLDALLDGLRLCQGFDKKEINKSRPMFGFELGSAQQKEALCLGLFLLAHLLNSGLDKLSDLFYSSSK